MVIYTVPFFFNSVEKNFLIVKVSRKRHRLFAKGKIAATRVVAISAEGVGMQHNLRGYGYRLSNSLADTSNPRFP